MRKLSIAAFVPAALLLSTAIAGPTFAQDSAAAATATAKGPTAVAPYEVTVFATGIPGKLTAPDSIAVVTNHVFIGYGDNHAPDGSDGLSTQVAEYRLDTGGLVHIYTVPGHNDGLKLDPARASSGRCRMKTPTRIS